MGKHLASLPTDPQGPGGRGARASAKNRTKSLLTRRAYFHHGGSFALRPSANWRKLDACAHLRARLLSGRLRFTEFGVVVEQKRIGDLLTAPPGVQKQIGSVLMSICQSFVIAWCLRAPSATDVGIMFKLRSKLNAFIGSSVSEVTDGNKDSGGLL